MSWSIRLDKTFSYRGSGEKWSNRYHFDGSNPADATEWTAICNALVTAEKAVLPSNTSIVYVAGYTSDTGAAVFTRDYSVSPDSPVTGTFSSANPRAPGDAAAWIRWWAGQYNSRGKKVYLRKYFHGVYTSGAATPDTLDSSQKTAMGTFGALLMNGLTVSGYSTRHIADKDGHAAQSYNVVTYITTRTLKRRGGSPL